MSLKVLCVDDDELFLGLLQIVLQNSGAAVEAVTDSEHAMEAIRQNKYDGIFLDLMMPNVDGLELANAIRRSPLNRTVPVVLITARQDMQASQDAREAGVTFILHKPIQRADLTKLTASFKGAMAAEQKRHKRVPYSVDGQMRVNGKNTPAKVVELGEGTIVVESDCVLDHSQKVGFSFTPPKGKPLTADGLIISTDGKRHLASFVDLSPDTLEALRRALPMM